jgi:hypothetical protein
MTYSKRAQRIWQSLIVVVIIIAGLTVIWSVFGGILEQ